MSADFAKIYGSKFFMGSMRDTPPYTQLLMIALLTLADEHGVVHGTPGALAPYINAKCTVEDVNEGLKILSSPDPNSTSPKEEGRRIIPWGDGANRWKLVNYEDFYKKSREEDRADYKREWDRQNRAKGTQEGANPTVSDKSDKSDPETERKPKGKEGKGRKQLSIPPERDEVFKYAETIHLSKREAEAFCDHFDSNGWLVSGRARMKDWKASIRGWKRRNFGKSEPAFVPPPIHELSLEPKGPPMTDDQIEDMRARGKKILSRSRKAFEEVDIGAERDRQIREARK